MTTHPSQRSEAVQSRLMPLLNEYMQQHGIRTVRDTALSLGISRTALHELLRDPLEGKPRSTPSVETLILLARAFQRPTHELLYLLVPDAPGAPATEERQSARERLRAMSTALPSTDDFLSTRQNQHGDLL
ncbi:helix-turn-helix domain-containing protein (plasmid) [Deinococcus sp. KNUC1210]|uniref:helix-turn-helix domain-containing protein n=1 Tax=Deinococcus sp. KNUC1210 TaxID=2917691 RepID=UPI001EF01880|nr:helix-turn-helix transcriptional regulator [Deinococcus sp. KNUC1210]ULH17949.1 helix-turn-helix domain-containing protein [Deinococcus sp. KNUC1210]